MWIRPARARDLKALAPIQADAARVHEGRPGLRCGASLVASVPCGARRAAMPGYLLVADLTDGRADDRAGALGAQAPVEETVVGFAHVVVLDPADPRAHLDELAVRVAHQGIGVGAALVQGCREEARRDGFATLSLCNFADPPETVSFYRRQGFRVLDVAPEYLRDLLADERRRGLDQAGERLVMLAQVGRDVNYVTEEDPRREQGS